MAEKEEKSERKRNGLLKITKWLNCPLVKFNEKYVYIIETIIVSNEEKEEPWQRLHGDYGTLLCYQRGDLRGVIAETCRTGISSPRVWSD